MLYCDYDTYTAQGGALTAEQFAIWAQRASGYIDRLTLGRAKHYSVDETIAPQLADACAQIVDMLHSASQAQVRVASGLAGAATTDGYSESYADASTLSRSLMAQALDVLRTALGADPKNLLYGGVCGCSTATIL